MLGAGWGDLRWDHDVTSDTCAGLGTRVSQLCCRPTAKVARFLFYIYYSHLVSDGKFQRIRHL